MKEYIVKITKREIYGVVRYYPANYTANKFLELTHKKTFDIHELATINRLGFTVEYEKETLPIEEVAWHILKILKC